MARIGETPDVAFEVTAFVTAEAVVLKNENTRTGTNTLFQERTTQNRHNSLKATAIDVIVQRIDVALKFENRHIERIAEHHRVAQIDFFLKRLDVVVRSFVYTNIVHRPNIFVAHQRVIDKFFDLLLAGTQHKRSRAGTRANKLRQQRYKSIHTDKI